MNRDLFSDINNLLDQDKLVKYLASDLKSSHSDAKIVSEHYQNTFKRTSSSKKFKI